MEKTEKCNHYWQTNHGDGLPLQCSLCALKVSHEFATDHPHVWSNADLRDEMRALRAWLQWCLDTKVESRQAVDPIDGVVVNSWAAVPIPDWDVKQKIQRIDEALAGVQS